MGAQSSASHNTLLLTGTIQPLAKGRATTLRADPDVRMQDYKAALQHYLKIKNPPFSTVIFCENSQYDLAPLEQVAREENPNGIAVKFFSTLSDCDPEYGKGHAELQMMDRAFDLLVDDLDETHRVWKVTGRLIIPNLQDLMRSAPDNFDLYIDLRKVPGAIGFFGTDEWADTRVFGFTLNGYRKYFYEQKQYVGTKGHPHVVELALYPNIYKSYKSGDPIVPRFRLQPRMLGIGAVSLKDYDDTVSRIKNGVRQFTRRFVPSLWL